MATVTLKQEISKLLKDVLLKVCQEITPFSEQLELHGLLLLETDGQEFCTVTFKDAKITKASSPDGSSKVTSRDQGEKQHHILDGELNSESSVGEGITSKKNLINLAVQDAVNLWQDVQGRNHLLSDPGKKNGTKQQQIPLSSIEDIIKTYENKKRSWNQMNWKREKNKNGKYECPFCYKEFLHATNLTRHQRTHHGRPQVRKSKSGTTSKKTQNSAKVDDASSCEILTSDHLEADPIGEKSAEQNNNKDNSVLSYQNDSANLQSNSVNVTLISVSPRIDYTDSSKNTQSFFTTSTEYPAQSSAASELSSSYMQTGFLSDDVYFNIPDSVSTPNPAARIVPQQQASINTADGKDQAPIDKSNNNSIMLSDSYMPLVINTQTVTDSTTGHSDEATSGNLRGPNDPPALDTSTVFKTKTGKEYINIADVRSPPNTHSCPLCQRKFDFYQNLGRHVQVSHSISIFQLEMQQNQSIGIQSGDKKKKYKCDICGHSFSFRSNLCRHKSKQHGPRSDPEKAKQNLNKINTGSGVNNKCSQPKSNPARHKCDVCGARFTFSSSLSRHMRKMHSLVPACLYKPNKQDSAGQVVHFSQKPDSCKSQNLSFVGSSQERTNEAEFIIPLRNCEPYGLSHINGSSPSNNVNKDQDADQIQRLSSGKDTIQDTPNDHSTNNNVTNSHLSNLTAESSGQSKTTRVDKTEKTSVNSSNKDSQFTGTSEQTSQKASSNVPKTNSASAKRLNVDGPRRKLPTERYKHKCSICNKLFTFRTNLTRHMKNIHRTCPDFPGELLASAS